MSDSSDFEGFLESDIPNNYDFYETDSDISVSSIDSSESDSDVDLTDDDECVFTNDLRPLIIRQFTSTTGVVHPNLDGIFLDQFKKMFTVEMAEYIVHETNCYAEQLITIKPDPKWTPVSLEEFWAFIGMNIVMGIQKLPTIGMYWSTDSLYGKLIVFFPVHV